MKIKYLSFSIFALTLSANGFAQSTPAVSPNANTSSTTPIEINEVKRGPLADFYELVAQYHLPKKENVKVVQRPVELSSPVTRELIAETKSLASPKP
ncbi:hypothetical protein [Undibacterium sp. Ji22W]|uniref:hypothetical protein n=1 Tax=Undibacterium sp. Ji22W TaxID=3413038 RepID=UPI003BEF754C